jgi:hypothetical protein
MYENQISVSSGMGNGITSGYAKIAGAQDRVLALDEATSQLGLANGSLRDLLEGMRAYADALLGEGGVNATSGTMGVPKIGGRLSGLRDGVQGTQDLAKELRQQFDRIRAL